VTHLLVLAIKSGWNRRVSLGLTLAAIALSVTLLLGIERLRSEVRRGFAESISGVDLVVGARGSPVQLMLYAVFRLGEATNNMSWDSVEALARHPQVAWTVPLSLGDSHRGFPVLGTTGEYFEHFRYGDRRALRFFSGRRFEALFDAVLGAEVAEHLGYRVGHSLTLAHGSDTLAALEHGDKPFHVSGILARTGTPVDRTVHVGLQAIEAIHLDWQGGSPIPGLSIAPEQVTKFDLTPKAVTAVLVGLKSRAAVFAVQRQVNQHPREPLMAVLPGLALDELWRVIGVAERSLQLVSALVVAVGLAGLVAVIMATLNERRRELAILRSVGARPADVFLLLTMEGAAVTIAGASLGLALVNAAALAVGPLAQAHFGLALRWALPGMGELKLLAAVTTIGTLASLLPGYRAYRLSLADGMSPRS
jgi:putative ABC transport system permease protein